MANFIFNKAKQAVLNGTLVFASSTLRILAVSATSAGTPTPDDDFLDDILGTTIEEIAQAGYSRQTLSGVAISEDDANDRAEADFDDINFGSTIASGDTVVGFLVYQQVGGDDLTPADDVLVAWYDTDSEGAINKVLGGGALQFQVDAEGMFHLT